MKRYIILFACMASSVSCSTTKKNINQSSADELSLQNVASQSAKTEKLVDTTKTESGKITITEVEFFPHTTAPAIKSIKQTTIEQATEQKRQTRETAETAAKQLSTVLTKNTRRTEESIAPDPYRWRYLFYTLALIAVALLYLKS
ncbi:MAG: hypothetical protein LBQ78_00600 [Tannerellaceae bacterium]|jgi:hypothetical protein|nr:hypothetical protein [Tannerellaceae bacterium]